MFIRYFHTKRDLCIMTWSQKSLNLSTSFGITFLWRSCPVWTLQWMRSSSCPQNATVPGCDVPPVPRQRLIQLFLKRKCSMTVPVYMHAIFSPSRMGSQCLHPMGKLLWQAYKTGKYLHSIWHHHWVALQRPVSNNSHSVLMFYWGLPFTALLL